MSCLLAEVLSSLCVIVFRVCSNSCSLLTCRLEEIGFKFKIGSGKGKSKGSKEKKTAKGKAKGEKNVSKVTPSS